MMKLRLGVSKAEKTQSTYQKGKEQECVGASYSDGRREGCQQVFLSSFPHSSFSLSLSLSLTVAALSGCHYRRD